MTRQILVDEDLINPYREPEPGFDEEWKPSEVFLALRLECKFFIGKWEDNIKEGQPVLNFCNHPNNQSDSEGNCYYDRCPLLKGLKWTAFPLSAR